jgi:ubiquinone/menaquinone biosynthesis C-methylase UbiE
MQPAAVTMALEGYARDLIERARPIGPSDRILDLGCGIGLVASILRERLGGAATIVGFDASRAMIEKARLLAPEMDWREGDVMALPFPEDSFELVLCQDMLRFVPDRIGALREVRRVLSSGGRLLASTWHASGDAPLDSTALRQALADAGFLDIRFETERLPEKVAHVAMATAPSMA